MVRITGTLEPQELQEKSRWLVGTSAQLHINSFSMVKLLSETGGVCVRVDV